MELPLEQYRVLVDAAPTMIWRTDVEGRCDYFNATWLDFTGRSLEEELGDGWVDAVHPDDTARCMRVFREHFARRAPFEMEYRLRRHDGVYRYILDCGAPLLDRDGVFRGFVGHCVDVHERRAADEAKATFLGMLAHELRTPLQSLVLFAAEAKRTATAERAIPPASVERLERQVSRIRRLVDHASKGLDAALREQAPAETAPTDLVALAEAAVEARTAGPRRDLRWAVRVEGAPRPVLADAERLASALDALLDNAAKFSPEAGAVELTLTFDVDGVSLAVADEGIGVPTQDLHRVGSPFFRGSNVTARSYPGLGLGLAVARAAAGAHGGRVELRPRQPRGTLAVLVLPTEPPR